MAKAQDHFDTPKSAEQLFENTLRNMNTGARLSIPESIERIIGEMEMNLDEIREGGTWNGGTRIKEGQRQEIYQIIAKPLLLAAQDVASAVSQSRGYRRHFEVEFAASGRTESLDLHALSERVQQGFNTWLSQVSTDNHAEMGDPALPLAINHEARYDPEVGISRLEHVLVQSQNKAGWAPKGFVANSEASAIMAQNAGDSVPGNPFQRDLS